MINRLEIVDQFSTEGTGDVIRVDFDGTLTLADADGAIAQVMLNDEEAMRLSQAIRKMEPSKFYPPKPPVQHEDNREENR